MPWNHAFPLEKNQTNSSFQIVVVLCSRILKHFKVPLFFYSFFLCFLAYYIWCNLIFIINWMSVVGVCTGTLLCDKASAPLALQWKVPPLPIPTHPPPQINQYLTECLFLRLSLSLAKASIMRRIPYILLIHGWDGVLLNLLAASINWVICNLP